MLIGGFDGNCDQNLVSAKNLEERIMCQKEYERTNVLDQNKIIRY